jgi:hypothetical protein
MRSARRGRPKKKRSDRPTKQRESSKRHATESAAANRDQCNRGTINMGELYESNGDGTTAAIVHSIALIVECMDKSGVFSFEEYRTKLMALWDQVPADDKSGAAAVFDQLSTIIAEAITKRPFRPQSHTSRYASGP